MRTHPADRDRPEVWGGVECSVVRIGDSFRDAVARLGLDGRLGDVARIAALRVKALRFPLLWERTVGAHGRPDWTWADAQLAALRTQGIRPIVGLVHHGSGPRDTSLLDHDFPEKLADYARAVARRYPWVTDFTPINEPLTTARFSALYGHWYPHTRGSREFCRALFLQCRAVQRAMEAIREETPRARLIQTEDYARIGSTPGVAYQAGFENERRWLSLDLLAGFVDARHVMYPHLCENGIEDGELALLRERPCIPDVIGVNYYVTSERWLDERIEMYPPSRLAGNGRDAYVDVEAVRACPDPIWGHAGALAAVWERYGRPVALTEVHLGGAPEEQLRWWDEAWRAALDSRRRGIDVRAVTAWALFGSHDWDSLLVGNAGHYEPGVYDVRSSPPKPTALARAIAACAEEGEFNHPVLDTPGWWRRRARFGRGGPKTTAPAAPPTARYVAVRGRDEVVARAVEDTCDARGLAYRRVRTGSAYAEAAKGETAWAVVEVDAPDLARGAVEAVRARIEALLNRLVADWCPENAAAAARGALCALPGGEGDATAESRYRSA